MFSDNDLKQIYEYLITMAIGSPTNPVNVATNSVTVVPTGTLITLDTDPTPLPTTPLTARKWIQFMNEDLVDIQ